MAIGMAYYDQLTGNATQSPDDRPIRETIPEGATAKSLVQLSMKGENIMVGDILPDDVPKHKVSPLAKVRSSIRPHNELWPVTIVN